MPRIIGDCDCNLINTAQTWTNLSHDGRRLESIESADGRFRSQSKLSITRFWVQNLSLPDERSNRESSRRIGFYSVYLESLEDLPFIQL